MKKWLWLPDLPEVDMDQMLPLDPSELISDQVSGLVGSAALGSGLGSGFSGGGGSGDGSTTIPMQEGSLGPRPNSLHGNSCQLLSG